MRIFKNIFICTFFLAFPCLGCTPEKIERNIIKVQEDYNNYEVTEAGTTYKDGGLLFAHMTNKDYGRLYYDISKDGVVWTSLNSGNRINSKYLGHPDIVKGPDERWYMISGIVAGSSDATLFVSDDLITWRTETTITKSKVFNALAGYTADPTYFGAPKLFYDEDNEQWIITWHATHGTQQDFTKMKTLYTITTDFKTFTKPDFLFDFESDEDKNIVTIDAIIRKIDGKYWVIFKDEREEDVAPRTFKTVRVACADEPTGPYTVASDPITPHWFEAPTIAPAPDGKGWFMWAENYPNAYYRFDVSSMTMSGWKQSPLPYKGTRHGCVVRINQEEYDSLIEAFGPEEDE